MGFLEKQGPVELEESIPLLSNLDVDEIFLDEGHDVHWQIFTEITAKKEVVEVLALEDSSTVKWNTYARIKQGGKINYEIDITSDGTTMKINITNNELETLNVKLIRFS